MRKFALLAAMLLACAAISFGQTRTVTGVIKDAQGNPIPFASVKVKGTQSGVAADKDGKFSINIPEAGAKLVITGAGFQDGEVSTGSQSTISIILTDKEN